MFRLVTADVFFLPFHIESFSFHNQAIVLVNQKLTNQSRSGIYNMFTRPEFDSDRTFGNCNKLWLFDEKATKEIKNKKVVYQGLNQVDYTAGTGKKNQDGTTQGTASDQRWHTSFTSTSKNLSVAKFFAGDNGVVFRISVVACRLIFADVSWLSECVFVCLCFFCFLFLFVFVLFCFFVFVCLF